MSQSPIGVVTSVSTVVRRGTDGRRAGVSDASSPPTSTPGARTSLAELDTELRVRSATSDFYRQFALGAFELCGREVFDLLHPSARTAMPREFAALAKSGQGQFVQRVLARRGDNQFFGAQLVGIPVRGVDDVNVGFLLLVTPDDATDPVDFRAPRNRAELTALGACILEGVAAGASTQQLAAQVYLSRQGVEYHVGLLLRRFNAPNRAALVSRAYSLGVLAMGLWPPRVTPDYVKTVGRRATSVLSGRSPEVSEGSWSDVLPHVGSAAPCTGVPQCGVGDAVTGVASTA